MVASSKINRKVRRSGDYLGKATAFSGPTMVFYVLIVTFATVDWVMSLDPHWFSTIWGLLFVAGWALSSFLFLSYHSGVFV